MKSQATIYSGSITVNGKQFQVELICDDLTGHFTMLVGCEVITDCGDAENGPDVQVDLEWTVEGRGLCHFKDEAEALAFAKASIADGC
jgi:hypothetical protein